MDQLHQVRVLFQLVSMQPIPQHPIVQISARLSKCSLCRDQGCLAAPRLPHSTKLASQHQACLTAPSLPRSTKLASQHQACLAAPSLPHSTTLASQHQACLAAPSLPRSTKLASQHQACLTAPSLPHSTKLASQHQACLTAPSLPRSTKLASQHQHCPPFSPDCTASLALWQVVRLQCGQRSASSVDDLASIPAFPVDVFCQVESYRDC